MKASPKNSTKGKVPSRKRNGASRKPLALSPDEERLIARPGIPIEWREGKRVLDRKLARLTAHEHGQLPKFTREIKRGLAGLRKRIANNPGLVADFNFFTGQLGWPAEEFLFRLFWDCNIKSAWPESVIAADKRRRWPINQHELEEVCRTILEIAATLGKISDTELSPAFDISPSQVSGFFSKEMQSLSRAKRRFVLRAFRAFPELLRLYSCELRGNILAIADQQAKSDTRTRSLVNHVRETSLYEAIRSKLGEYHAVRLHRLVNAARETQGLQPISWDAFRKWLKELKERLEKAKQTTLPSP